jgi:hypothetical protein
VLDERSVKLLYLKLGSAKGCQVLRASKMRNGGRVLMVVLNLYVQIKIPVATFDNNHPVTDSTQQSIAASVQKLSDSVVKSVSTARYRQCRCVRRSDQVILQFRLDVDCLRVLCVKINKY